MVDQVILYISEKKILKNIKVGLQIYTYMKIMFRGNLRHSHLFNFKILIILIEI